MPALMTKDLSLLRKDGCQLIDPEPLFVGLMIATAGNPCETGCGYFDEGKCPAYQKHHTTPLNAAAARRADYVRSHTDQSGLVGGKWFGMSIKQIAAREGISLNEARRRKQAGAYAQ